MTTLVIQTDRILENFHLVQQKIGNTMIIPDLSANAYGLGDVAVAKLLRAEGLTLFAVSRMDEARRIRDAVRDCDILLLTPCYSEEEAAEILELGLTATITSTDSAVVLSGAAGRMKRRARAHLRFDTGADTCGFLPGEAGKAAQTVKNLSNLDITGVYSSLKSGAGRKAARTQFSLFSDILTTLRREDLEYGLTHMLGAADAMLHPFAKLDAVRMGVELTGRLPVRDRWNFRKTGRLSAEICDVRWIPGGHRVGTKSDFRARKAVKLALVAVGTADGLTPAISRITGRPLLFGEVAGKRVPAAGTPGHTHILLNVTGVDCACGDRVSFDVAPGQISPAFRRDYV